MNYKTFVTGPIETNTYLVWSGQEAGIIDPGGPVADIIRFVEDNRLTLKWIVNTHGHADHIAGNSLILEKYQVPIAIHEQDRVMLTSADHNLSTFMGTPLVSPDATIVLTDSAQISLGDATLQVLATPGHTKGSISLYGNGLLFAGDTLFYQSIGRTDLPGGDYQEIITSIERKLLPLPPETVVLPGHGCDTTLAHEHDFNPFIKLK
ncbi:MAG TPA: MBL fold metallo-hydrolase [Bacillota bacterium]|jgi:hydroxyacylglutathione hydrolase|nr:MBL fold metallo-hydrolase [Bacillota bacterium]HOL10337.1 MBL fold metallo-hydrolase [Bacillota bacterium]HPO97375.1 MBL fold metallo-hydrolase [Bacillota bacterium]